MLGYNAAMSDDLFSGSSNRTVISVSDLNRLVRRVLETGIPMVHVEGEISNFYESRPGHWYFTLKDESAQMKVVMFRGKNQRVRFQPQDGSLVTVSGNVGIYEAKGDFQLNAESMEESGEGALLRAFEELKRKLDAEGLFDKKHKQELPGLPQHLGIITSPGSAAVRDVLTVLRRRFPALACTILPVQVQGAEAGGQVISAIEQANRHTYRPFDLLLLTRGGGSLEDLWTFNLEAVARAIFASRIPIVSAIGHEIDYTIADFAADLRAPTPSAAAELISPNADEWLGRLGGQRQSLHLAMRNKLRALREKTLGARRRLRDPGQVLQGHQQTLDRLQLQLTRQVERQLEERADRLESLPGRFYRAAQSQLRVLQEKVAAARQRLRDPRQALLGHRQTVERLQHQLARQMKRHFADTGERTERLDAEIRQIMQAGLRTRQEQLGSAGRALNAVSPLAVLFRGYSVTTLGERAVRSSSELNEGDEVRIRFGRGSADARIQATRPEDAEKK